MKKLPTKKRVFSDADYQAFSEGGTQQDSICEAITCKHTYQVVELLEDGKHHQVCTRCDRNLIVR
jgi:hypothetical protein